MLGSPSVARPWRALFRIEVLAICFIVFCADVVTGMVTATFSRFATDLGASVALVGTLTGFTGLVSIVAALPLGVLSDQVGRRWVVAGGMLCFTLANLFYTFAPNPYWLFPGRILTAVAMLAVFTLGMAYLGDVVSEAERPLAVGLYSTSMGLGFTVGPALGGLLAERYGYGWAYQGAGLLALVGVGVALWGLAPVGQRALRTLQRPSLRAQLQLLMRNPPLVAASSGALVNSLAFASLFAFFPLYAAANGRSDVAIGALLAGRALASTVTRIPTGLLATRLSNRGLLGVALLLLATVHFTLAWPSLMRHWGIILVVEGIAYGMFLVAGQSFVTKHAGAGERGAALGLYGMAGSIGSAVGPVVLGVVATVWGLAAVFPLTGLLILLGIGLIWWLGRE